MVDKLPKWPFSVPEVEQPSLAPDLEWMLTSSQASEALIAETIVREHYTFLVRLLHCLFDDEGEARQAVHGVILNAVDSRRKYKGGEIRIWLASLAVEYWQRQQIYSALKYEQSPASPENEKLSYSRDGSYMNVERRLGIALKSLPWDDRLPLLLQDVLGFTEAEIGQILHWDHARIISHLDLARRQLQQVALDVWVRSGNEANDSHLLGLLQQRWPVPQVSTNEIELAIVSIQTRLDQRRLRGKRLKIVQQLLMALAMLVFMAFMGWLTNRYAVSEHPVRTVVVTRLVTQQGWGQGGSRVHDTIPRIQVSGTTPFLIIPSSGPQAGEMRAFRIVEITPGVTPIPPLFKREPLKRDSSEAEIRLRMIESRALWHSARVEALIVQSGPSGYIGAPRVYRNLVWLSHDIPGDGVDRRLVLSGDLVGDPLYAFLIQDRVVNEVDLISGLSYTYPITAPDSPFYSLTAPEYLSAFGLGPRGILNGTYLFRMLFPATLATEYGALHRIGWDQLLGREVVVVDKVWHGVAKSRLWVDAQTGIVLRWKRLDENDPMIDIDTITVTALELEASFPDERWIHRALEILPYDSKILGWQYMPVDVHLRDVLSQRVLMEPAPTPEGFDPSNSHLFFQWKTNRLELPSPGDIAEIFTSEGFLLGRVPIGDPWDLICERSPDGRLIAYAHSSQWSREFNSMGVFWFSLDNVSEVHHVLPNAVSIGSDFAFSPDGRYLAFWGCGGNTENCGVYIHDTRTLKNMKLLATSISEETIFMTWSPNGELLAMVKEVSTGEPSILLVVQVSSGKIIYIAPFPWRVDALAVPADSPIHAWGVPFPPPRPGLEGCIEPPPK